MQQSGWRKESPLDVINLILGIGLLLSPWLLNFTTDAAASRNAWVSGLIIGLLSLAALSAFADWEEWGNIIMGIWVVAAPWALGFQNDTTATTVHVIIGLIVAVLAAIGLWSSHKAPPRVVT